MTIWTIGNVLKCTEQQGGLKHTGLSGSGILSPVYATRTRPSSALRARYSTQNGPWCRRGSFDGRLCLLSKVGTRRPTCHSAVSVISSSIVNSRVLFALYHHNPFFHRKAPFSVASILFNPKFFGVGQILHLNAIFWLFPTVHRMRIIPSLISYDDNLQTNR